MNNRSLNILSRVSALLLISAAFTGMYFLNANWAYEGRFWQNWYPLLIPVSRTTPLIETELQSLSGHAAVTSRDTVMQYSDYKGLETLSLKEFAAGKGPYRDDPRIDPYMKGISAYFNQNIYEIFYLPSDKSPLEYQRLFSGSYPMENAGWILPDWKDNRLKALVFASVLLLLCTGAVRYVITASAFAAAGFIAYSRGQDGILLVLAVTALFLRLSVMKSSRFSWYFLFPFLPAAAAYFWGLFQIEHLQLTGLAVLSFAGISLWPGRKVSSGKKRVLIRRASHGKDHSLFEPVSLFDKRLSGNSDAGKKPSFVLMTAAFFCLILGGMNLPGEDILPAGIPFVESSVGEWGYDALVQSETSGQLPAASDYLKHRAYQESFLYGGSYSLPVPGTVVSFEDYHMSEGRVFESSPTVLIFSDSWYESRLLEMAGSGPGKLLASESSPPVVSTRSSITVGISLQMLLVFAVFICVFVLIHISGLHHASVKSGIRSSGKFVLRRKQQAA